jgi:hypothetical protein
MEFSVNAETGEDEMRLMLAHHGRDFDKTEMSLRALRGL